jgi:hypothetical protein
MFFPTLPRIVSFRTNIKPNGILNTAERLVGEERCAKMILALGVGLCFEVMKARFEPQIFVVSHLSDSISVLR